MNISPREIRKSIQISQTQGHLIIVVVVSLAAFLMYVFSLQSLGLKFQEEVLFEFMDAEDITPPYYSHMDSILFQNAYRISNDTIIFPVLKESGNMDDMKVYRDGVWKIINKTLNVNENLLRFSRLAIEDKYCNFKVTVYVIESPRNNENCISDEINIQSSSDVQQHTVRIVDKGVKKNELAVCSIPLTFVSNWSLLVTWFEMWIYHGADRFIIYYHTITPQVRKVLEFYAQTNNVVVELVPLGDVNTKINGRGDYFEDVNTRLRAAADSFATIDCNLRAINSGFVLTSSIQDLPLVDSHEKFLTILQNTVNSAESETVANITVVWSEAFAEIPTANRPSTLRFNTLHELQMNQMEPSRTRKLIRKTVFVPSKVKKRAAYAIVVMQAFIQGIQRTQLRQLPHFVGIERVSDETMYFLSHWWDVEP